MVNKIWNLKKTYLRLKFKFWPKPLVRASFDYKLLQRSTGKRFPSVKQFWQVKRLLSSKEKIYFNFALGFLLVGLLWLGMVMLWSQKIDLPKAGGTYTEAEVGSPQLINPIFASTNDVDADIAQLIYSGLMHYDQKLRLVPNLAVKYTLSDDKKTYTFELRKDVLWHDNQKFTAKDVMFTIDSIQNMEVNSPLAAAFQGVKVEAINDYIVKFTLSQPYAPFLSALTVGILPEHLWFNIEPSEMRYAQFNLKPIGTGPFKFKKITKDQGGHIYQYDLERNDKYYRQPAYLKEFVFNFFPTYDGQDGALQALREQKVDALSFVPYNLRDKVERKYINLYTLQLPQYTALFFNQNHQPLLKDKDFRAALSYAADRERIVKEVLKGEGQSIYSPILPGFLGFDVNEKKYAYSPVEANKLLDVKWSRVPASDFKKNLQEKLFKEWKDAQPKDASSTPEVIKLAEEDIEKKLTAELSSTQTFFRQDKSGNVLELTLVTVDNEQYKKVAAMMASFWQEIGVKVKLQFVAVRDFNRDVLKERSYDVLLYGEIIGNNSDPYPFWHSSQISYPGLNLANYNSGSVDTVIEKARLSTNNDEQIKLYQRFSQLLVDDVPAIFLYTPTYTYAVIDSVKGIEMEKILKPGDRFAGIMNWYIKTKWAWK